MGKLFYTEKALYSSEAFIKKILSEFYDMPSAVILQTKNGKPYIENGPYFSISHTEDKLFALFSSQEVGLDVENLNRKVNYLPIVKKFPISEQEEITCEKDFLYHWVAKESAIKYLGGTIAYDLKDLSFQNGKLFYKSVAAPFHLQFIFLENYLLGICSETALQNLPTYLL